MQSVSLRRQHGKVDESAQPPPIGDSAALLKPAAAAEFLNICERSLWSLTDRREIRAVRMGRSVRYDRSDLRNYIEHAKSQGGPQ